MSNYHTLRAWVTAGGLGSVSPTIEEMADAMKVSPGTARNRLEALVEDGMLEKRPGQHRCYEITMKGRRIATSF